MQPRRGHKRTHSANLVSQHYDENSISTEFSPHQNHSQIVNLLRKSQLQPQQKVFQIDLLNIQTTSDQNLLFNFGKGLSKGLLSQRGRNDQQLIVIPEKRKHHLCKVRKHSQIEMLYRKKDQSTQHSILKTSNRQVSKSRVFNDSVPKILKEKLKQPIKVHAKKISLFQCKPKTVNKAAVKHKKTCSIK